MKAIQLRMARAAVGWGVRELAKKAGVTANDGSRWYAFPTPRLLRSSRTSCCFRAHTRR
jgi:hypothetical protein